MNISYRSPYEAVRRCDGRGDAMNRYAANRFDRRVAFTCAAGHGMHLVAVGSKVEGQVGNDLACGGGVRIEEAVEEQDLHPAGRITSRSPRTRQSMLVRTKQSSASAGVHTIGSLSLKEVLRTMGIPVRSRKASMSRW